MKGKVNVMHNLEVELVSHANNDADIREVAWQIQAVLTANRQYLAIAPYGLLDHQLRFHRRPSANKPSKSNTNRVWCNLSIDAISDSILKVGFISPSQ